MKKYLLFLLLSSAAYGQVAIPVTNAASTGTTINELAVVNSSNQAVLASTSSTAVPTYIVIGSPGVVGQAQLATLGPAACIMDSTIASGAAWYYVIASVTNAGYCHAQSAAPSANVWVIGYLSSTSTVSGVTAVVNVNSYTYGGSGGGGGTTTNPVTFNSSGSGGASGTTFNGSTAPTISWNTIGAQQALTLTTTGTSGAATLSGGALNIPQYSGGGGSGTVNSGTANHITWYAAGGTAVSSDTNLDDGATTANTLTYAGVGGVSTPQVTTTGSGAGLFQAYNSAGTFYTNWGSGATANNTINGFATAPTSGDLIDCVTTSTTCLLTDTGLLASTVSTSVGSYAAHKFWGNNTGSSTAPSASSIGAQDWSPGSYVAGGGSAQAQTITLSPAVTSLVAGLEVRWKPTAANTGAAPTLAVNGLTATAITKLGATALVANDLTTAAIADAIYDGTQWELQNPQTTAGGGSGTVSTCSTVDALAYYAATGTTVSCDTNLTDVSNQLIYAGGSGINITNGGLSIGSKIGALDGHSTVSNSGVPGAFGYLNLASQTATLSAQTIVAGFGSYLQMWRVSCNVDTHTTAASNSLSVAVNWTSTEGSRSQTIINAFTLASAGSTGASTLVAVNSTANITVTPTLTGTGAAYDLNCVAELAY